ncbi:MAG: fimbiral protein pilA [Labilithrix sp.]|nr:fimbiral protein pilA [Labilithrix sp.]
MIIAIVAGVVLLVLVGIIGVLAVLGIYGTRKYIANAKTAEARNAVAMMARDAAAAYESSDEPGASRELCPSARAPVPASVLDVSARKYMSSPSDWSGDPGFSCLGFEMSTPQYYQYDYKNAVDGFTAIARGDLDGDGVLSSFVLAGHVQGGLVVVAPTIVETNPEE